jgi:hypothetical protein
VADTQQQKKKGRKNKDKATGTDRFGQVNCALLIMTCKLMSATTDCAILLSQVHEMGEGNAHADDRVSVALKPDSDWVKVAALFSRVVLLLNPNN